MVNRMHQSLLAMMLVSLHAIAGEAWAADSFRCGNKVIRTGDLPGDVLARCGEPLYRDRGYADGLKDSKNKSVRVERWYYKNSERSLGRIVLIYQGRVAGIETGAR